jgi:hypothetical protein
MGKHERTWVEIAEKAVTDSLNNIKQNQHIEKISKSILDFIDKNFDSKIEKCIWVGGRDYNNPGDVHVYLISGEIIKIELKFSHKSGSGTVKNPTSNYFQNKICNSIIGYQEFDDKLGLKQQRYFLVENKLKVKLKTAKEYQKALRNFRDSNDPIIDKIAEITSPGQEQYAKYVSNELNKHLSKVNEVTTSILNICNTDSVKQDVVYCVIKDFENIKQTVEFFDFTEMDKNITIVKASGKSIKFCNSSGKDVIRFSVTWKNICQGGQTPCFNVFIGNAFRN